MTALRRPSPVSSRRAPTRTSSSRHRRPRPEPAPPAGSGLIIRVVPGMGRGVFAGRPFRKGEVIEVCPVIPLPRRQTLKCVAELLDRYVFQWPQRGYPAAVVLGYGSLYNHSHEPNARYAPRKGSDEMIFRAARDIAVGEQILVNYEWPAKEYHFPVTIRPAGRASGRAD